VREQDVIDQVRAMPDEELWDTRRDLEVGIGLMRPQSPMHAPASAYLAAVNAELARRAGQQA
jgi:hypothetical protein